MAPFDARSPQAVEQLIAEARALAESNRALQARLRGRNTWRLLAVALAAMLAFYAWSINGRLAENMVLLRSTTDLVEHGNALLRTAGSRQAQLESLLGRLERPPQAARPDTPRRQLEACPGRGPGCDSSTYWVPGFPGPRTSTKRTAGRPIG
jgi:hypothetical protein